MVTNQELEIRNKCEEINDRMRNKNLPYRFTIYEREDEGGELIERIIVLEDRNKEHGCQPTNRTESFYSR
jgi:hypothetical protein